MSLDNQRIVVIGGSSGLGLGIAKAAALAGAHVIIASRSSERLASAKAQIEGSVEAIELDVRSEEMVRAFFGRLDPFDHLATPGNEGARGPFLEMETTKARAGFDSKFWGQYMAAKYAVPKLRPGGSIVFVSGTNSQRPGKASVAMAAINSAVEGLTRGLAVELAPLRVNCVSPGMVDTPLWAGPSKEQREATFRARAAEVLAGRVGRPHDIAQAALYLMQDGYVTGTTLFVDGGVSLR
jgi:NAD(P)-dependent dehydrogenase (short-subunit alcohol dehydrogenase family)